MLFWAWMAFAGFVGAGFGWWLCSTMALAKLADMQADIQTLVEEKEHWARERQKWAVRP